MTPDVAVFRPKGYAMEEVRKENRVQFFISDINNLKVES